MSESVRTLLYHLPTNRHYAESGRPTDPLRLSLSTPNMSGKVSALSQCASRCTGLARLYLRFGCGSLGGSTALGRASDGRRNPSHTLATIGAPSTNHLSPGGP